MQCDVRKLGMILKFGVFFVVFFSETEKIEGFSGIHVAFRGALEGSIIALQLSRPLHPPPPPTLPKPCPHFFYMFALQMTSQL